MNRCIVLKNVMLCFLSLTSYVFSAELTLTSAQTVIRDEETSSRRTSSLSDHVGGHSSPIVDDLRDLELGPQEEFAFSVEDFIHHLPTRHHNITEKERKAHIAAVLNKLPQKSYGQGMSRALRDDLVRRQARARNIVIHTDEDDAGQAAQSQEATRALPSLGVGDIEPKLEPAFNWLAKKVIKKDVELMGRKFDRQQVISVVAGAGAFAAAIGLEALWNYIGTFYQG